MTVDPFVKDVQTLLARLGYTEVKSDGLLGPITLTALQRALGAYQAPSDIRSDWMPDADMRRIIVHWTAGGPKASDYTRQHYHFLIEDDGALVKGVDVRLNQFPKVSRGYAPHTLNANTGAIGVALCGMLNAVESPFDPGPYPLTEVQWERAMLALAALCSRYRIAPSKTQLLSHAEVQGALGIKQRGKWDIARLPFKPELKNATEVGDLMRHSVATLL